MLQAMNQKVFVLLFSCLFSTVAWSQQYQFAKSVGGTGFENAMGIALDSNKNIIVCGYFAGTADFNPSSTASDSLTSAGFNDVFLAKYDSSGNYLWAINIGGPNDEFTYSDPLVDAAGNIYVCGQYSAGCDFNPDVAAQLILLNNGSFDGFIAKYNSSGNLLWAGAVGGVVDDQVYRLDMDNQRNILFGGSFDSTADLNASGNVQLFSSIGQSDFFFGKIDSTGNLKWVNALGGFQDDNLNNITHDAFNNVVITGTFVDSADFNPDTTLSNVVTGNSSGAYLAKYDSSGNYLWAFPIENAIPFGLSCDTSNSILTCGEFSGAADFNPGATINQLVSSSNSFDVYFAKYDTAGNYVFAKKAGGTNTDNAYAIREMSDATLLVAGYFFGTADFNPGTATNNLTANGFGDMFVAHYDNAGNYINAFRCGGAGFDFVRNFACDADDNFFIAGGYEQTVDFNPAPATNNLVSVNNSRDGFFARYGAPFTDVFSKPGNNYRLSLYPNPFVDEIAVSLSGSVAIKPITFDVYDLFGKKVHTGVLKSGINIIHLQDLNEGVYLLKADDHTAAIKIVKL